MTYGIRIFRQDGKLTYDSSSVTWNQVESFIVPANTSLTKQYPLLQNATVLVQISLINSPPFDQRCIAPDAIFTGTLLNITAGNAAAIISVLTQ